MFKKVLSLVIIAILAISCLGSINAGHISIDADGRLVHKFTFTDLGTGETIWQRDVAAGDEHGFDFDSSKYKYHEISIQVTYEGSRFARPDYHIIHVACWDAESITLKGLLDAQRGKAYYKTGVMYIINDNWHPPTAEDIRNGKYNPLDWAPPVTYSNVNM